MDVNLQPAKQSPPVKLTVEQWRAQANLLFGPNRMQWRFVCPSCGHVASAQDWKNTGAAEGHVGYSCIGRFTGDPKKAALAAFKSAGGPCNYAGGGLFNINPIEVDLGAGVAPIKLFAFGSQPG
jgi:hypothetical protein